ncbi:hypothetical protein [Treponema sp.]|uniref:hypothetical protein n=1 Tax=Treponema sp. TaxID=166 RepID=UPI00298E96EA|nr:hypothetical protein [Treponema sp.]MCQ2241671.1 hypothetical protein [Treponema sp.]
MKKIICLSIISLLSAAVFAKPTIQTFKLNGENVKVQVELSNYTEYDKNGNIIHTLTSMGSEFWWKYDSDGNVISYKHKLTKNDVKDTKYTYENGLKVYSKDSSGKETWFEYDENRNLIHTIDSFDFEQWYEYDENNNRTRFRNSNGSETWYEYNSEGRLVNSNTIDQSQAADTERYLNDYDDNGNIIHTKYDDGFECWYKYTFWDNGKIKKVTTYTQVE